MNSLTFLTLFVCFISGVFTELYGRIKYLDEEKLAKMPAHLTLRQLLQIEHSHPEACVRKP